LCFFILSFLGGNSELATKKQADIYPNSIIENVGGLGIVKEFMVSLFVCQMLYVEPRQRVRHMTQNDEYSSNLVN
jgi:hypothetical protein